MGAVTARAVAGGDGSDGGDGGGDGGGGGGGGLFVGGGTRCEAHGAASQCSHSSGIGMNGYTQASDPPPDETPRRNPPGERVLSGIGEQWLHAGGGGLSSAYP